MSNPDFMDCVHRTCTLRPAHLDISHAKRDESFESNVGLLSEVASTKSCCTADFCKRVVFGDLLLHLVCELLFSFCTRTITCGTKTEQ
jgi:hypothetical protein